jgi:hypothetical protein
MGTCVLAIAHGGAAALLVVWVPTGESHQRPATIHSYRKFAGIHGASRGGQARWSRDGAGIQLRAAAEPGRHCPVPTRRKSRLGSMAGVATVLSEWAFTYRHPSSRI